MSPNEWKILEWDEKRQTERNGGEHLKMEGADNHALPFLGYVFINLATYELFSTVVQVLKYLWKNILSRLKDLLRKKYNKRFLHDDDIQASFTLAVRCMPF